MIVQIVIHSSILVSYLTIFLITLVQQLVVTVEATRALEWVQGSKDHWGQMQCRVAGVPDDNSL